MNNIQQHNPDTENKMTEGLKGDQLILYACSNKFSEQLIKRCRFKMQNLNLQEEAEDIVQDVYLKFIEQATRKESFHFADNSKLYTYLKRSCTNHIINISKRSSNKYKSNIDINLVNRLGQGEERINNTISDHMLIDWILKQKNENDTVTYKDLILFAQGYTYQEIADMDEKNIGTIKFRINTQRTQLQKALKKRGIQTGYQTKKTKK